MKQKLCCLPKPVQQKYFQRIPDGVSRAVGIVAKRWTPGQTIEWYSPAHPDKPKIQAAFNTWQTHANLLFLEVANPAAAKIRIGYDYTAGSWSYLGTDALSIPSPSTTLNIGWSLTAGDPTALHEVGHAIGLEHEHQSTNRTLQFDVPQLYSNYAASQGWTTTDVDQNIINQISTPDTSPYDPNSIMHYVFYSDEILAPPPYDIIGTPYNTALSPIDEQWAQTAYPTSSTPLNLTLKQLLAFTSAPQQPETFTITPPVAGKYSVALIGEGIKRIVVLDSAGAFVAGAENLDSSRSLLYQEFIAAGGGASYTLNASDFDGNPTCIVYWDGGIQ